MPDMTYTLKELMEAAKELDKSNDNNRFHRALGHLVAYCDMEHDDLDDCDTLGYAHD